MAKSSAQATFESILDTPAAEVPRPSPAPAGSYDFIIKGLPEYGESSQKKTPFARFTLGFAAPADDVDEDELKEWIGEGSLGEKTIKITFYTTPDAMFRLTDFLEHCGIDPDGKTVRQMIDETPNCSVRGLITHRASEDGQQIFAEVKRTMRSAD